MSHSFSYAFLAEYWPLLVKGAAMTLWLITFGASLGVLIAVLCNWARLFGPVWLRLITGFYVEFIRNTPFLIQLFFIFFGLPRMGLAMPEVSAAILALALNLGAYGSEIIRAGLQATARGQWEAGQSLGMTRNQTFWRVVLIPALQKMWPTLSSQIVIVMLGSAVVSQIAVQDLTQAGSFIQSRTFRAFETYFVITGIYILLAALVRLVLLQFGRRVLGTGATQ